MKVGEVNYKWQKKNTLPLTATIEKKKMMK